MGAALRLLVTLSGHSLARLENLNYAADDPPVILAPLARRVVGKMRLDRRPLLV